MAPITVTEDYYLVLQVTQNASLDIITRSFRRLALKLHPDHNRALNATADFQLLHRAWQTLKDSDKRRQYDSLYKSSKGTSHTSPSQSQTALEAAQIEALQKSIRERATRWQNQKATLDAAVSTVQKDIRQLKQQIENLRSIAAAEKAQEAWNKSWTAWIVSPLFHKAEETEDQKAIRDRERQERRLEKDMKERRLISKEEALRKAEQQLQVAQNDVAAAKESDNARIIAIHARKKAREERELQDRRNAELARQAEAMRKRWEQQEREEAENRRRQAEYERIRREKNERRAQELRNENERLRQEARDRERTTRAATNPRAFGDSSGYVDRDPPSCRHEGWWSKIQGRSSCPRCYNIWTYLLQCPGCAMQACPPCQAIVRPRGGPHRVHRSTQRRAFRTASPDFYDDYY